MENGRREEPEKEKGENLEKNEGGWNFTVWVTFPFSSEKCKHVGALSLTAAVEMISSDHRGNMVYLTAITIHITLQLVVVFLKISLLQTTAYICFPNRAKKQRANIWGDDQKQEVTFVQIGNGWIGFTGLYDGSGWDVDVGTLTGRDKLTVWETSQGKTL